MVAGGQHRDPQTEHFAGRISGNAGATGHIFAVGHHHVWVMLFAQARKEVPDRPAARLSVNIPDKENTHYLA